MSEVTMDKIVSLCKRRGFIFQSSEIYGGLNGAYDYGPLGVQLKNNIRDAWWKEMTQLHDNIVGLDASILMHPRVWEASGHVSNFTDPMVDCKQCKSRFRADQIDLNAPCPICGNKGTFTAPRNFNLMFATHIGADLQKEEPFPKVQDFRSLHPLLPNRFFLQPYHRQCRQVLLQRLLQCT